MEIGNSKGKLFCWKLRLFISIRFQIKSRQMDFHYIFLQD